MDNSIQSHFKFDIYSLSYAEFIIYIADAGQALDPEPKLSGTTVTVGVTTDSEMATALKLKFGYFQIKVKSQAEIDAELASQLELMKTMLTQYTHEFSKSKNKYFYDYETYPEKADDWITLQKIQMEEDKKLAKMYKWDTKWLEDGKF